MTKVRERKRWLAWLLAVVLCVSVFTGCNVEISMGDGGGDTEQGSQSSATGDTWSPESLDDLSQPTLKLKEIPAYSGTLYVPVHKNQPDFTDSDREAATFEYYSELDDLGRCGVAFSNVAQELMPEDDRDSISSVKPTGWHSEKYDCVSGKYLYNRCHLIGYQLTGENANACNLITGTRALNVEGMLPFENMVTDYVKETGNHVLYRVTPIFEGDNLVATGVEMEGESVEDGGEDILFHVFVYNVQNGVSIDYATGESQLEGSKNFNSHSAIIGSGTASGEDSASSGKVTYVLNTKSMKYHTPDCSSLKKLTGENRVDYSGTKKQLEKEGYSACGSCKP